MWFRLAAAYAAALLGSWPGAACAVVLGALATRGRRRAQEALPALLLAAACGFLDVSPREPPVPAREIVLGGWIASTPESFGAVHRALLRVETQSDLGRRIRLRSRSTLPAFGTRVEVRGRLRPARPPRNFGDRGEGPALEAQGAGAILEVDSLRCTGPSAGPAWRREVIEPVRARVRTLLSRTLAPREAALLEALVVGLRDRIDRTTNDTWSALGVNHILSISGMHVALVAGVALVLFGPPRRRRGLLLLLGLVWAYAALGGLGPTVLRASSAATWGAIAVYLSRARRPLAALGLVALGLVLLSPHRRHDLGLQLSCLATAGILAVAPAVARFLDPRGASGRARAWLRGLAATALCGLAAQTATLPLQIATFGCVSWGSPLGNAVLVPMTDASLVLGLLGAPLALLSEDLGRPFLLGAGGLLYAACEMASHATSKVETRAFLPVGKPILVVAWIFAAAALGACWAAAQGTRRTARVLAATSVLALLALGALSLVPSRPAWQLEALDVGQGDALVLALPEATWLVDTGDRRPQDQGERVVVPQLRRAGVRRLRGLVLSHPHRDHAGGAASVLGAIPVDTLYVAFASRSDSLYAELRRASPHTPLRTLARGDEIVLAGDYRARVVWPDSQDVLGSGPNGCSLVLWAHGNGHPTVWLAGDLESDGETRLLDAARAARALAGDGPLVLKAGHHGSHTSSSPEFLAALRPDLAILCVGAANRYGHPGPRTLAALAAAGAAIHRTDRGGAIRLVVRGTTLWLERPAERATALESRTDQR